MNELVQQTIWMAFRYALGRRSYVVEQFCDAVTTAIREISADNLQTFVREIDKARADNARGAVGALGADVHEQAWLAFQVKCADEIARRGEA